MSIESEELKEAIRRLSWSKVKVQIESYPCDESTHWHLKDCIRKCDSMVDRRPKGNGKARDKFLESLKAYYIEKGREDFATDIEELHTLFKRIDIGYRAIFAHLDGLPSSSLKPAEKIFYCLAELDVAAQSIASDIKNSINPAFMSMEQTRAISGTEGQPYDPNGVLHGLTFAATDIVLRESYAANWFDECQFVVLPELKKAVDFASDSYQAEIFNAHWWRRWKGIDERVRYLNAELTFIDEGPWPEHIAKEPCAKDIKQLLSFKPNKAVEQLDVVANERLSVWFEQNLHGLIRKTNVLDLLENSEKPVALPPSGAISLAEAHATVALGHLTKLDIAVASDNKLTIAERLRGYAALQMLATNLYAEHKTHFPSIPREQIVSHLVEQGLSDDTASYFLDSATFRKSSRDLYDQPLIKTQDDKYYVFGLSLYACDLTKVVLSSLANENIAFPEKGSLFEDSIIQLLIDQGFNARNVKVRKGDRNEEFDYDVVFTWGDYVFFIECKNRNIPHGNPIAHHYYLQDLQGHLGQIQRLKKGLSDYPCIISKEFPEAVGKTPIFCLLGALPYSIGKQMVAEDDAVYIVDESIFGRFFESSSLNILAGKADGKGVTIAVPIVQLWNGAKPTPEEFIKYLTLPPQIKTTMLSYRLDGRGYSLGSGVFVEEWYFNRLNITTKERIELMRKG